MPSYGQASVRDKRTIFPQRLAVRFALLVFGHAPEQLLHIHQMLLGHGLFSVQGSQPILPSPKGLLFGWVANIPIVRMGPMQCIDSMVEWSARPSAPIRALPPANIVLALFFNNPNALQDIGDIVNASLLHLQLCSSPIQVDNAIGTVAQELDKTPRQEAQRVVVATNLLGGGLCTAAAGRETARHSVMGCGRRNHRARDGTDAPRWPWHYQLDM